MYWVFGLLLLLSIMKGLINAILLWGGLALIVYITFQLALSGQSSGAALFFFVTFFIGLFWFLRKVPK
jgi:hypothetical protein